MKQESSKNTPVRVAIYTRKSTEEGLEQEFNSLDNQRQCCEAYVKSQCGEGWIALPERYDDAGFTGANTNRPGFQSLLQDIEAGKVDVICVYKIDRLSRSLLDFAKIIAFLEKHGTEFVAVTQQFSTANSIGKLTLNILMSFSEFERQVISERTRDKMAATRKRGMWTGGHPPLGYDVVEKKLVVNEAEAERVRQIFQLYLERRSLKAVVSEIRRRGWRQKATGRKRNNKANSFDPNTVSRLLKNPLFIGKVKSNGELYDGQHQAIVSQETWDSVQDLLEVNRQNGGRQHRNKWGALLRGLIRCARCGEAFVHQYSSKGNARYHFYVCRTLLNKGAAACPGSRVSMKQIEDFIFDKIAAIGSSPELIAQTVDAARKHVKDQHPELVAEIQRLRDEAACLKKEQESLAARIGKGGDETTSLLEKLGVINEKGKENRLFMKRAQVALLRLNRTCIDEEDVKTAFASFVPIWDQLFPANRESIIRQIVERIVYNGETGDMEIHFNQDGIKSLALEASPCPSA